MLEPLFSNEDWVFENKETPKRAKFESAPGHNLSLKPKNGYFSEKGQKRDKINLFYQMKLIPYSKPKIYNTGNKWHIEYHFDIPEELKSLPEYAGKKRKRFKVYENLNRLQGEEKEIFAEYLREKEETMLINGYSPFDKIIQNINDLQEEKTKEETRSEPLYSVLDTYLKAKIKDGISTKSVQSYTTAINHIKSWLEQKGQKDKPADHFTEEDIITFLDERATFKGWTPWTYNINREYVFMWFNWMELNQVIAKSPLSKRLAKRIEDGVSKNESYHGKLREKITKALKLNPMLDRFCKLVYYTCTRPQEETIKIKVGDINLKDRVMKIYGGKTGSRQIPVSDELYKLLINEFKINDADINDYLASFNCLPGKLIVSKNYFARHYLILKRAAGIPDTYGIYSWKHTRINDLLSAKYSDAEVIQLTGHKGTDSYDTYKRSVGKHLESRIKGKTVNF